MSVAAGRPLANWRAGWFAVFTLQCTCLAVIDTNHRRRHRRQRERVAVHTPNHAVTKFLPHPPLQMSNSNLTECPFFLGRFFRCYRYSRPATREWSGSAFLPAVQLAHHLLEMNGKLRVRECTPQGTGLIQFSLNFQKPTITGGLRRDSECRHQQLLPASSQRAPSQPSRASPPRSSISQR